MTVQDHQLRIAAKNPCRIASTVDLGLTGLAVIDGVTPVAGDRVLAKDQTAGEENGIYVAASGAWARALDMDDVANDRIEAGLSVYIQEGTANTKKTFVLTTSGAIVLDTTALVFELGPTAGAGSSLAGSTGATDNALLRADGTGGATVQASGVTVDDSQNMAALASVSMVEQASAPVVPGAGNGAFWVKQETGVNLPAFTDENALDLSIPRSITLARSMPAVGTDSVELGSFSPNSAGQSFSLFVYTGTTTSNDYVAHHRFILRNANNSGGFQIHQPLYTSGPLNNGLFGDMIQVEVDVAVGGAISLRARSYIGIAQTVYFRLGFDGDDLGVFTPSSTQATTAAATTNLPSSMLTMTELVHSAFAGTGIVAWKPFYMEERAAADTDTAGFGQLWVQNTNPNVLVFTNDVGTDTVLGDMSAPSSSVDNALPRFNGTTGKLMQGGNASNNVILNDTGDLLPEVNDGGALGSGTFGWSDLFIASGGVINFVNGDVTITHFTNTLSFAGAASGYNFDAPLFLTERAAALANQSTKGQLWIKNETPSAIVYSDDIGVDASLLHYSPVKRPCRLATTANIADLAAGAPDTVDGVTVVAGNRILVKNQSTGNQNGIYRVVTVGTGANGAWVRDGDWAVGALNHIEAGVETYIQEGTQSGTRFTLSTTGPITVGTTAITFA